MKTMLAMAGMAAIVALSATSAMAARDNFDRDSLGKRWVVTSGSLYLTSNQLQGDSLSLGYDKRSGGDSTVKATVYLNGTDLEYGAVASGNISGGNNAFVKIQADDGSGKFVHGAFYTGNNGSGSFFSLNAPVSSPAKLSVSFCGTLATMTIKSAEGTQQYQYDYGTSFGTGGGLGTYGLISLDNYKSRAGGGCEESVGAKAIRITHSTAKDPSLSK